MHDQDLGAILLFGVGADAAKDRVAEWLEKSASLRSVNIRELFPTLAVSPDVDDDGVGFPVRDVFWLDVDLGHVGRGVETELRAVK